MDLSASSGNSSGPSTTIVLADHGTCCIERMCALYCLLCSTIARCHGLIVALFESIGGTGCLLKEENIKLSKASLRVFCAYS